ncbi:hypothetical protein Aph01nite_05100 [Acrocarpospora phusangensis]|uniref:Aminoglycoside phosphotransferase domain-containing protein n=1 Tax=Acrocarpospora phusangensis TaxID=1070424 RepID=A0A919Q7Q1_9ACTN|nr:aminotransferase family protein [Acrocarpospora phusangensis]GIH22200.1 hypothetical protein Aph01nite_05100 [Acrocarpospora phusangensis]
MTGHDFFAQPNLLRPEVSLEQARAVAAKHFRIVGEIEELGSNQDRNFRVDSGRGRFLLKVPNSAYSDQELDAQDRALLRLAEAAPELRVARPELSLDGGYLARFDADGTKLRARLLSFVPGFPLYDSPYLAPVVVGRLGAMAGRVVAGLADFEHPGLERMSQWDLRNARRVVETLIGFVRDEAGAERVLRAVGAACDHLDALAGGLRVQAIHGDVTDDNVVCERDRNGRARPTGLIDFGDLGSGWLVAELATTCASILHHSPERPLATLPAIRAFHEIVPLDDAEIEALWPAIIARTGVLVVSAEQQELIDPDNDYATQRTDHEWREFDAATSLPAEVATAAIRAALSFDRPVRSSTSPGPRKRGEGPLSSSAVEDERGRASSGVASEGRESSTGETRERTSRLLPTIGVAEVTALDLATQSEALRDGNWLDADAESRIVSGSPATTAVFRYGEARLTRTNLHADQAPETVALGAEIFCPPGTPVVAPFDGILRSGEPGSLILMGAEAGLHLHGIKPAVGSASQFQTDGLPGEDDSVLLAADSGNEFRTGDLLGDGDRVHPGEADSTAAGDRLRAGDLLGYTSSVPRSGLWVQLCTLPDRPGWAPPAFVTAETAEAWRSVCPDPSSVIGFDCAAPVESSSAEILELRRIALAEVQGNYYDAPPRIERGWRQHLTDLDGRTYLDMVNNVAAIGHAHPRLSAAVARQWGLLNTNSRFNYKAIAEFSKRLADLLPDPLDTVFLVNSGSEAVDLALRLAQTFTQRQDVFCVTEAYHGWTIGSDAISTSTADNPNALSTRPSWVHPVLAPNTFRGEFRGADAGARYVEDVRRAIAEAVREGRPPAAFVCEAFYGNAGGVPLPDGYLTEVYADVRAAGGLCVADEVQVGYGRLGHHFWGFEQQGVIPDIVTVAKAMGNGHPLGAVITRRDVAETFSRNGYFFSSAGGSPVSCAVGTTVLDVIADEGLQRNAAEVGDHIRRRVENLDHPMIGAVHGMGLYMGVELVRDRTSLEPAAEETAAICERMRELGVIVQPTGDHLNVLKIKPPMCLTEESADFFVDKLDQTLRDGW